MLSCARVKTELFENADVTSSIYYISEHAYGSLGIARRHHLYLFLDFEYQRVYVVDGDNFEKAPRLNADIFSYG